MNYIAILGRQPELGLLELECQLGAGGVRPFGKAAIINKQVDINRLGGAQKIGRIIHQGKSADIADVLDTSLLPVGQKAKITFGLSFYGIQANKTFVIRTASQLKKKLRQHGSVRFVPPKEKLELTAAQIKFNKMLEEGFELLVVVSKQQMVIALTEQVQDIDWYSKRDYERPARSAKVGMLPPKLAQIMVNTTSAPLVYDPFCGTGVVLQEALLLGLQAAGSDNSPEMLAATHKNLSWLADLRDVPEWSAEVADAKSITLPREKKLAIVSEGYLGPNLSTKPSVSDTGKMQHDLKPLYLDSLKNWSKQIPSGTEVTITFPVWHTQNGWKKLDIIDAIPGLGYNFRSFAHTDAHNLIYRRPDQTVGRQMLLLTRT
ncbi:MAG TPA: hypothetical protein VNA68_00235 [Candidatus Dormibacteraeota bacterium]|nr:hypothetical protein [Candidatus Dormibacteraeota bacterium]